MDTFRSFADFQMDVLREVGNIGAGHAATALSKLMDKPVDMLVPKVRMVPFEEVADSVGGAEAIVIAIFLRVEGETPGNLFFILTLESAKKLLKSLAGIEVVSDEGYTDMEMSALNEIGNIMAGSYLSSLADFTKLNMQPTVPSLAIDMAGAILGYGLLQFGEMGDQALLIDTKFLDGKEEVEGHFFLIPDPESFPKIFQALGVGAP
ncbi:chemotaxis protein CheC [Paenibacillus mucilaginosus]|uniref:Chemotactic methyltransferase inhibitor n=3 Tax=Paenibacillus mucilaginosus TaxID=61624 RepID=H6NPE6_9BACL|nr:chemotaxis protein CheC [Paenibacillus mucilaginosus]AEI44318.1 chemotactic methyltransferase inhibitor [Paenibacillus mucilaginosus KNP414]AFC31856.1 chemotactic methyltransferase inhibitor [Paenibacillus mucilaginosus 3016]AFH64213.1 chemotaxis protein CheY [Paenibacillus mucilaginosus K02]MCG7217628.1 chemotaxis protein CheC [Paenibacillus mucilaginosus]WDM25714.1 chemotaxis protein CheC [Paenibacillus mucilaginosus]